MASPPVIEDPAQASRRAKVRVGVALTLLITAIGILAVLNQHKTAKEPAPTEAATPPVQASISSQDTEKPAVPEPAQIPEGPPPQATTPTEPTPVTPPPPPVPGKLPVATPPKMPQATLQSSEKTGGHVVTANPEQAKSVTKATPEPGPIKSTPEAAKPGAPKDFEVQLGVFSDMENAKQLQAKLAEHGIPSHTETRVQVGPFKTRAEADQAREKLKALGISAVIAPK